MPEIKLSFSTVTPSPRPLFPPLAAFLIRFLGSSLRVTVVNPEFEMELQRKKQSIIYAFWHGRMLLFAYAYQQSQIPIAISRSRDGELLSHILHRLGYRTIRGSSSRGGAAVFRALWEQVAAGSSVGLAPDGPRGPRYQVKKGIIALAQKTGAPILPMTNSTRGKIFLRSWDQFLLPFPLSQGVIIYGPPLYVPADADETIREQKRQALEQCLITLTERADRFFASTSP